jgi:hypothetical protein
MTVLIILIALAVFEVLALRFGVDTRDGTSLRPFTRRSLQGR